MAKIEKETTPVEVIGVSIKKSEIQEQVGLGLNKQIVDIASAIIKTGIQNKETKDKCAALILRMANRMKEIKKFKDAIVKKMKAAVADAEEPFKNAFNELSGLKTQLSDLYTEYDDKEKAAEAERVRKELQAEEDRKAAQRQAEREQQAVDEEADLLAPVTQEKQEPVQVPIPPVERKVVPPVEIKTGPNRVQGVGTLSVISTTKVRIIDPAIVPVAYKVPSEQKLMEAYDAGITSIPGVEFYVEKSTRSLTK